MMEVVATTGLRELYKVIQSCSQIVTTNKPTSSLLQTGCPSCRPTNSVKALKGNVKRNNNNKRTFHHAQLTGKLHKGAHSNRTRHGLYKQRGCLKLSDMNSLTRNEWTAFCKWTSSWLLSAGPQCQRTMVGQSPCQCLSRKWKGTGMQSAEGEEEAPQAPTSCAAGSRGGVWGGGVKSNFWFWLSIWWVSVHSGRYFYCSATCFTRRTGVQPL